MVKSEQELIGIVAPADWDTNGNVNAFVLATHDEEEYQLQNYQKEKLLTMLRKQVKISGVIEEDSHGKKAFTKINNVQLI